MTTKTKSPAKKSTVDRKGVGGRPSKYDPAYCEAIVEHMSQGASATSFAAAIGVSRSTITEWASAHPEFSAAVTRGKAVCAAWWERLARSNAMTGKGNATLTVFGLKNMAPEDWADRIEHTGAGGGAIETVSRIEYVVVDPK